MTLILSPGSAKDISDQLTEIAAAAIDYFDFNVNLKPIYTVVYKCKMFIASR